MPFLRTPAGHPGNQDRGKLRRHLIDNAIVRSAVSGRAIGPGGLGETGLESAANSRHPNHRDVTQHMQFIRAWRERINLPPRASTNCEIHRAHRPALPLGTSNVGDNGEQPHSAKTRG